MGSLRYRSEHYLRNLVPFLTTVALLLLSLIPLRLPGYASIVPMLTLTAVYYWGLHRSDLLPAMAVFFIGILQDLLSGAPIGLNTGILLFVYGVVISQRRYLLHEAFFISWISFMAVAASASLLQWAILSLLDWTTHDPSPGIFQYLFTISFYPCLAWGYARIQQAIFRQT